MGALAPEKRIINFNYDSEFVYPGSLLLSHKVCNSVECQLSLGHFQFNSLSYFGNELGQPQSVLSIHNGHMQLFVILSRTGLGNLVYLKTFSIWTTSIDRFPADIRQLELHTCTL